MLVGVEGRQHHDRWRAGWLTDPPDRGEPVDARHPQIHEHDIGPASHDRLDPGSAVVLGVARSPKLVNRNSARPAGSVLNVPVNGSEELSLSAVIA